MKVVSKIISVIFHPLLMLTYGVIFINFINPYLFGHPSFDIKSPLIMRVFMTTFFLPSFAVFILVKTELIKDFQMEDKMDRIGPLIITFIFYFWTFLNFKQNGLIPWPVTLFTLGISLSLVLAFIFNVFTKISLHTIGAAGIVFMCYTTLENYGLEFTNINIGGSIYMIKSYSFLLFFLIITGIIGTARLILQAHNLKQIFQGYLVGIFGQILALFILGF